MSKDILIVESSLTLQKIFTRSLDDFNIRFETNLANLIEVLFEYNPDVLLLNSDFDEPSSFDYLKIIRSIECFRYLPVGMYTGCESTFDEDFAASCGSNAFVRLDPKTLFINVDELSQVRSGEKHDKLLVSHAKAEYDGKKLLSISSEINKDMRQKNKIITDLFSMMKNITSIEDVVSQYLSLIADFTQSPLASLSLIENDGPHSYYIVSSKITETECSEFLKVCKSDFENLDLDSSLSMMVPYEVKSTANLDAFRDNDVPLSSYLCEQMYDDNDKPFGTIHILKSGTITKSQTELFNFGAKNASMLFDKVLMLKKKLFFEKRIRKAFSLFVPDQVIDSYVASVSDSPKDDEKKTALGEKRPVAVLFSDIRSFTNISECNKPEVMIAFLNRYFTIMCNIIKKHGGTIDKFIGDAIMALFGAPVSYEDNTRRVVAAAYEMREALATVPLGDLVLPEGMSFNIGIGINYGDLTVGSLGSEDRTSYTVIGDNVNLASRLEGLSKTYGSMIIVSDSVKKDIEENLKCHDFVFRYLDDVRVKGKATAVPIYGVDRDLQEFSQVYRDSYNKGFTLYKQGIFNLAKEYFEKCLADVKDDKASLLMKERCDEFISNPPENWDGAIKFNTK